MEAIKQSWLIIWLEESTRKYLRMLEQDLILI